MKKAMKLLFILCLDVIFFTSVAVTAYAEDAASGTCGDNLTWVLDEDGTLIISGTGIMNDFEATGTKTGYYTNAPWYGKKVVSVIVNDGVTYIGNYAFAQLTELNSINISDTVLDVGTKAFQSPDLKNIKLSDNMSLDENMFSGTSIENITLPKNTTEIPASMFDSCKSLKTVVVSDGLMKIGADAFYDCTSLESINLPDYVVIGGRAFKNCSSLISISEKQSIIITPEGGENFYKCSNLSNNIILSEDVNEIYSRTFYACSGIKKVILPSALKVIYFHAFDKSGIISINLPEGLEVIKEGAFSSCHNLKSVEIPDSVIEINQGVNGNWARDGGGGIFGDCTNLEEIKIGKGFAICETIFGPEYGQNGIGSTVNYYPNLKKVIYPQKTSSTAQYWGGTQHLYGWDTSDFTFYYTGDKDDGIAYIDYRNLNNEEMTDIECIYEVNYDANGGNLAPSYQPKFPGEALTITSKIPVREGYTFLGWSENSNESIAAYKPGSKYYPDASATLYAVWKTASVPVTGVTLNKTSLVIEQGGSETLTADVAPSDATDKTVMWESSNTSVVTVADGRVTAIAPGTAEITVTTADGGYTASCTVTVTEKVIDENAPRITISDIKARPGNEVQVTVEISGNTGFASLGIEVGYNSEVMTLTNVTPCSGVGANFTPGPAYTVNPFNMSWDGAVNVDYNGNLATLTFAVKADAPDGVYPITLDYYKGVNGDYVDGKDTNYDENFDAVGFVYVSGSVAVASYTPGDLTGDDRVNSKDATYLLRYLAKWELADLVTEALDIDGSGTVNNKDATILLRYLAGWEVTLH